MNNIFFAGYEKESLPSFEHLERVLHSLTKAEEAELLAIADGEYFRYLDDNEGSKELVHIPYDKIREFMRESAQKIMYVYHTHPHIDILSWTHRPITFLAPPSASDFYHQLKIKETAEEENKQSVSRIVEKFGIWEYSAPSMEGITPVSVDKRRDKISRQIRDLNLPIEKQLDKFLPIYDAIGTKLKFRYWN